MKIAYGKETVVWSFSSGKHSGGNPCPIVVVDEMDHTRFKEIAKKNSQYSETAFVISPQIGASEFQVRYYTPLTEIPFAGHPTLATAHFLQREGFIKDQQRVVFQLAKQNLQVDFATDGKISFQINKPKLPQQIQSVTIDGLFNVPMKGVLVDAGTPFILVNLEKNEMEALKINTDRYEAIYADLMRKFKFYGIHCFSLIENGLEKMTVAKHFSPPR